MNWILKNIHQQSDGESWLANSMASLRKSTINPAVWNSVRLKIVYKSHGSDFYVHLDPWYIAIEESQRRITLSRYIAGNLMEVWDLDYQADDWIKLEVTAELSSVTLSINGQNFSYDSTASVPMTSAELHFAQRMEFLEPEFSVDGSREICELPIINSVLPKSLEFTIDFYDDLQLTSFNPKMLEEMFGIMARLGATQTYWIHHGERGNGFWEGGTAAANIERTFEMLGDDYLPAAVSAAHKVGLPLIGIFKPFDTAIVHYTSSPSTKSDPIHALGGSLDMGFCFPVTHPELCQQRRNVPLPGKPHQINICSRHRISPNCAEQIKIYVSHDNSTYSIYHGPIKITAKDKEIQLSELAIQEDFMVLAFASELAEQIQNTLPLLIEMRDANGDVLDFTYGIAPRVLRAEEYHLAGALQYRDFREHGLNFDCAGHGVPSAVWNSRKPLLDLYSPANSNGVLGLAFGCNAQVPGVLSEAEPEAHDWWLSEIEKMLDAGVDGVEIRMMNHSNIIDWSQYGFNKPLVEKYFCRYGVDITREEFSREKFRALRGEVFTEFLRKASNLVRERGKKFRLHIEDSHQSLASEPCPMEIAMPWRQWIAEKICDGVTLKALNVWSNDTAFGREVIAACHAQGIPVSFAPFIHSVFASTQEQEILDSYRASSYDAFKVYEFATLFEFTPEGNVKIVDDAMLAWLRVYNWSKEKNASL